MVKNILIVSSDHTGHGHKSITEALCEQFSKYSDVKVTIVDGFGLGGNFLLRVGKLYGSVTRNVKELWRLMWEISMIRPAMIDEIAEITIRDAFFNVLKESKPDLILSVHPNFNGSIINILEEYNLDIPFITFIADLVSISPLWTDPRADYIICPTLESKEKAIEFGVPEPRTKVIGFPVRKRFYQHIKDGNEDNSYHFGRPLECFIMSGGEGSGNMGTIAKVLLKNFNSRVKIVTGRNHLLKKKLETQLLEDYGDRVTIYGFVDNIQELMISSDIVLTRGSPNTALEAVMCNVPLIITGALPGQEEGNPAYFEKYKLGIECREIRKLKGLVNLLLDDDAKKLNELKKSQREFRDPDVAQKIVEFILSIEKRGEVLLPEEPRKLFKLPVPKTSIRNIRRKIQDKIK